MHHALDISEILYNIFGHLAPDKDRTHQSLPGTHSLAKLARTCRAFKEPALDVLWSELPDLSALARCVPDAIRLKKQCHYAFKRPLTEAEWVTIRSYACRVWTFLDHSLREACLEKESVAMLFSYSGGTLFPSLRFLSWGYGTSFPLLHTASQPLRMLHLDCRCGDIPECRNVLESVGNLCPLIMRFRLQLSRQYVEFDRIVSSHVCRWSNLRILECNEIALGADAILHVSRLSRLTHLSFVLSEEASNQISHSDLDLIFPNLTWCNIASVRLMPVAKLFARTRLPAIKELTVRFPGSPCKQVIQSFMIALRSACSSGTLTYLSVFSQRSLLHRLSACGGVESNGDPITYDELYPCMTLGNLRSLKLNFEQPIHLTDADLVQLGSAWPYLEDLTINNEAGWRVAGGLTLHGLIQLLRACPALCNFSILLDTPTFVRIPEGMDVSFPPRQFGRVNLVESRLDADVFAGVKEVFALIGFSPRFLIAWRRVETVNERQVPFGLMPTQFRSWRELADGVKARIASASESKDSKLST